MAADISLTLGILACSVRLMLKGWNYWVKSDRRYGIYETWLALPLGIILAILCVIILIRLTFS